MSKGERLWNRRRKETMLRPASARQIVELGAAPGGEADGDERARGGAGGERDRQRALGERGCDARVERGAAGAALEGDGEHARILAQAVALYSAARISPAARMPVASAPCTVPLAPSAFVASPAKKSVPSTGAPSAACAGSAPTGTQL